MVLKIAKAVIFIISMATLLSCCLWVDSCDRTHSRKMQEKAAAEYGTHFKIVEVKTEREIRNKNRFIVLVGESTTTGKRVEILIQECRSHQTPNVGEVHQAKTGNYCGPYWYIVSMPF